MKKEINLNHICKIEGHASLSLKIENNKWKKCELQTEEGARFFEALVLGKKVEDVQEIVSRICGICSSSHSVCCVQALEEALGIKPSEKQKAIRELLMLGERFRSHVTHLYFMALPDYLGVESALQLGENDRDKIDDALKLISLGNKIVECVGGRELHPFLKINETLKKEEIRDFSMLIRDLKGSLGLIKKTIDLFSGFKKDYLKRDVDFLCLTNEPLGGKIKSNSGEHDDEDYKKHLKEGIKEYATSKFVLKDGKPYVVGAVARLNNSGEKVYDNNFAQAVELEKIVRRVVEILEGFNSLKGGGKNGNVELKAGHAVSAVEAPRGTLFHEYKIDKSGKVSYCNIITPTCQNLNSMELDIKSLVDGLLEKGTEKDKIVLEIEKLIRAYDPCFSCSTHFLRVDWE